MKIVYTLCILLFHASFVWAQQEFTTGGRTLTVKDYLQLSKEREQLQDYRGASDYLNKAALLHWEKKELRPAITYFQQSLRFNEKVNNQSGMYGIYSNLAMIYADLAKYDSSLLFFKKTLEGRRKSGENVTIISALVNTSVILNNLKRHNEAAEFLEEALKLAQEMNDVAQMRSCYGMLAETYEKAGNDDKKTYYFNLYKSFHELLQKRKIEKVEVDLGKERLKAQVLALEKQKADLEIQNQRLQLQEKEQLVEEQQDSLSALTNKYTKTQLAARVLEEQSKTAIAEKQLKIEEQKSLTQTVTLIAIFLLSVGFILLYFYLRTRKQKKQLLLQHGQLQEQSIILEEQHEQLESQKTLLEKKNNELEASNNVKDKLFSIIAHDLRTPFNSINGYLTLIKYEDSITELRNLADEVRLSVDHTVDTLNNVLAWAKTQMQGIETQFENIEVARIIKQQQAFFKPLAQSKSITIENAVDPSTLVWADYNQIDVVIRNLVGNALKFTPNEGKVMISAIERGSKIMVSVSDTGVGMSQEDVQKLFKKNEHFTKDGTNNEKGTGLGLLLCKDFVEANGGSLEVSSELGKGTTFTFDLMKAKN